MQGASGRPSARDDQFDAAALEFLGIAVGDAVVELRAHGRREALGHVLAVAEDAPDREAVLQAAADYEAIEAAQAA